MCKTDEKPGGIATYTCFDPNRKLVEPRSIQEVKNTCSDAGHHGYQVDTSDCEYDPATGGCLGYCTYNTLDKDNGCERGDLEIGVCHETAP